MDTFIDFIIRFIYSPEEYVDSSGRTIALSSFTLGTLLLLIFLIFEIDFLIVIGILFVLFCILINGIILLILLTKIGIKLMNKQSIKSHLITLPIMLINIPITILYINLVASEYKHLCTPLML